MIDNMHKSSKSDTLPRNIASLEKGKQPKMIFNWNTVKSTNKKRVPDTDATKLVEKDVNENGISAGGVTEQNDRSSPKRGSSRSKRKRYPPPPHIIALEEALKNNVDRARELATQVLGGNVCDNSTEKHDEPPPLPKSPPPILYTSVKKNYTVSNDSVQSNDSPTFKATGVKRQRSSESDGGVFDGDSKTKRGTTTPLYHMGEKFRTFKKHIRRGSVEILRNKFSPGIYETLRDANNLKGGEFSLYKNRGEAESSPCVDSETKSSNIDHELNEKHKGKRDNARKLIASDHSRGLKPDHSVVKIDAVKSAMSTGKGSQFDNACLSKKEIECTEPKSDYEPNMHLFEQVDKSGHHTDNIDVISETSGRENNGELEGELQMSGDDESGDTQGESSVKFNEKLSDVTNMTVTTKVDVMLPTSNTPNIHEHTLNITHDSSQDIPQRTTTTEQVISDVNRWNPILHKRLSSENKSETFLEKVTFRADGCADTMNKERAAICLSLPEVTEVNKHEWFSSVNNVNTTKLDSGICQPSNATQQYKLNETDTISSNNTSTSGYESSLIYTPTIQGDDNIFDSLSVLSEDNVDQTDETAIVSSLLLKRAQSESNINRKPVKFFKRSSFREIDTSREKPIQDGEIILQPCAKNEERHEDAFEFASVSDGNANKINISHSSPINDIKKDNSSSMEIESFELFTKRKTFIEETISVDKNMSTESEVYPVNDNDFNVYFVQDHKGDVYKIEDITDQETIAGYSDVDTDATSLSTTGSVKKCRTGDNGLSRQSGDLNMDTAREVISAVYGMPDTREKCGDTHDNLSNDSGYHTTMYVTNNNSFDVDSNNARNIGSSFNLAQKGNLVDENANTIMLSSIANKAESNRTEGRSASLAVEKGSASNVALSDGVTLNSYGVNTNGFMTGDGRIPVSVSHSTDMSNSTDAMISAMACLGMSTSADTTPYTSSTQIGTGLSNSLPTLPLEQNSLNSTLGVRTPLPYFPLVDNCSCNIESNTRCTTKIHIRQNATGENIPHTSLSNNNIKYDSTMQTLHTNGLCYGNNQDITTNLEHNENQSISTNTIRSDVSPLYTDKVISVSPAINSGYNTHGHSFDLPNVSDLKTHSNVKIDTEAVNSYSVNSNIITGSDLRYSNLSDDHDSMGNNKSKRSGSYTLKHTSLGDADDDLYQSFNKPRSKPHIVNSTPQSIYSTPIRPVRNQSQSMTVLTSDIVDARVKPHQQNGDVSSLHKDSSQEHSKNHIVLNEHPTKTEIRINPELRDSSNTLVKNTTVSTGNTGDSHARNDSLYISDGKRSVTSESFNEARVSGSARTNKSGTLYRSNSEIKLNSVSKSEASVSLPSLNAINSPSNRLYSSTLELNKNATVDIGNSNNRRQPSRYKSEAVIFVNDPVTQPIRVQNLKSSGSFSDIPIRPPTVTHIVRTPSDKSEMKKREIIVNGSRIGGPSHDLKISEFLPPSNKAQQRITPGRESTTVETTVQSAKSESHEFNPEPVDVGDGQEKSDIKVIRGNILIRNKLDSQDEDDLDNINLFDQEFTLNKLNPMYQSDPDIYKSLQNELEAQNQKQEEFRSEVAQDITFEKVDKLAKTPHSNEESYSPKRERYVAGQQKSKKTLSQLLLSKLSSINKNDIRQHIDVEHTNEEIYGDISFLHADGSKGSSTNTQNFDSVSENVELMMKEGKALIEIKVTAERYIPIDYEFNVWRKSAAIVKRHIEIDLFANKQRKRLYEYYMSRSRPSAIEDGSQSSFGQRQEQSGDEAVLSSIETLKLFGQLFDVADGKGDSEQKYMKSSDSLVPIDEVDADFLY